MNSHTEPNTHTHTGSHAYPLSVSWPRRRTRCTSLWSSVPVKRLAWSGPFAVWPHATWTAARHTDIHPSITWASMPDPIGRSGNPSNWVTSVLPFPLWLSVQSEDPGWAGRCRPGSRPSPGVHSRVGAKQRERLDESSETQDTQGYLSITISGKVFQPIWQICGVQAKSSNRMSNILLVCNAIIHWLDSFLALVTYVVVIWRKEKTHELGMIKNQMQGNERDI